MDGFEPSGLIRFFIQVGMGVAGAASLWGMVLAFKKEKELSGLLMWPFLAGFALFILNWFLAVTIFFPAKVFGHEGIIIKPSDQFIVQGLEVGAVFIFAFIFLVFLSSFLYFKRRGVFQKYATTLFFLNFIVISLIAVFGVFNGQWDRVQVFFSLRGWHSILTLGTVIMVDFLYTVSWRHSELKRVVYPLLFYMSLAIWVGLGIDFVSVFLILEEAMEINTQFIFNQMLIGIIIINGAFLSGPVNDKLIGLVKSGKELAPSLNNLFALLGSISIVSWASITFLDFFEFDFSYFVFAAIYVLLIAFVFLLGLTRLRSEAQSY
ncbi:MAG: hypothetical protein HY505_02910 [Candidatus Yanofskybacteria bacterium]|nr:hypothetical protein [Candidatus Yanofskybacteria bacterium]